MPGWLCDAREGILDSLGNLFLVVNFLQPKKIVPTPRGIISLNARENKNCANRHSRHSSASLRFQTGLVLASTRSRRILF